VTRRLVVCEIIAHGAPRIETPTGSGRRPSEFDVDVALLIALSDRHERCRDRVSIGARLSVTDADHVPSHGSPVLDFWADPDYGRAPVRQSQPAPPSSIRAIQLVFTLVGIVLVAVGTFSAAPELRRPIRAAASAIADVARALRRRAHRRGVVVTPESGRFELRADRPSMVIHLDTAGERWREQVRDLLAKIQQRLETLEAQVDDEHAEIVQALGDLRYELLESIGLELDRKDARHMVSRAVGAVAIVAGTVLLALAPYV
jgi:hypothetical protein